MIDWKTPITTPQPLPTAKLVPSLLHGLGLGKDSAAFPSPGTTQSMAEHWMLLLPHSPADCCQHSVPLRATDFRPWFPWIIDCSPTP